MKILNINKNINTRKRAIKLTISHYKGIFISTFFFSMWKRRRTWTSSTVFAGDSEQWKHGTQNVALGCVGTQLCRCWRTGKTAYSKPSAIPIVELSSRNSCDNRETNFGWIVCACVRIGLETRLDSPVIAVEPEQTVAAVAWQVPTFLEQSLGNS